MSLRPAFEIGLWNAWIITVLRLLTDSAPILINKEAIASGMGKWEDRSKTEKIALFITHAFMGPALVVYSIFLPLKLGTAWLYVGLPNLFSGPSYEPHGWSLLCYDPT